MISSLRSGSTGLGAKNFEKWRTLVIGYIVYSIAQHGYTDSAITQSFRKNIQLTTFDIAQFLASKINEIISPFLNPIGLKLYHNLLLDEIFICSATSHRRTRSLWLSLQKFRISWPTLSVKTNIFPTRHFRPNEKTWWEFCQAKLDLLRAWLFQQAHSPAAQLLMHVLHQSSEGLTLVKCADILPHYVCIYICNLVLGGWC